MQKIEIMKRLIKRFFAIDDMLSAASPGPACRRDRKGHGYFRGAVVGATVYQDGKTSNGTATDAKGVYHISVPGNATLVFSYLGYRTESVKVAGKTKVDVVLEEDKLTLDAVEVVSVGYGSVARRDLTGSVSKVEMDELLKTTNSNFDRAIAGKIAGVVVTSPDGQIGAEANITIRGNNSLTQSNAPLYVIDGFPTESSMAGGAESCRHRVHRTC